MQARPCCGRCSLRKRASRWFPTIPVLLVLTSASIALTADRALSARLQPGWPKTTGGSVNSSPALADLDGDGDLEVVVGSYDKKLYVWHHDGTPLSGWPKTMAGSAAGHPAVGDLDDDGDLEVVATAIYPGDPFVNPPQTYIYAWHHNGTASAGWPKSFAGLTLNATPALGDLDGDGDLEVVFTSAELGLIAWHHYGTTVVGWPKYAAIMGRHGSPTLGDLDADGDLELIFEYNNQSYSIVRACHHDGTEVAGWPVTSSSGDSYCQSSLAFGDLDGDGDPEVVVGSNDGKLYVWHHDGTTMVGWPQATGGVVMSSPALGDLDGDGDPEVVVGSNDGKLHAWHHDGTTMAGWPQTTDAVVCSSPALADLDGDADLEVVVGSTDGNVYAWHHGGAAVDGWPVAIGGLISSSPALADLDRDGDVEVVLGSPDSLVYAWTCDVPTDDSLPWQMFGQDMQRTGCYQEPLSAKFNASPTCGTPPLAVEFTDQSTGSPDSWSWDLGDGATSTEQHPSRVYVTVGRRTVSLTVSLTADNSSDSEVKDRCITVTFPDVLNDYWACNEVLSCVEAGIVAGYDDGLYRPEQSVTRDQMAVFIARALAGGETSVPAAPETPTFSDVPNTGCGDDGTAPFWAYKHIEYCVAQGVVQGYSYPDPDTPGETIDLYEPTWTVTRDQMAVFVARAKGWIASGDDMTTAPEVFPDVPAGYWSGTAIQACVDNDVVTGYQFPDPDNPGQTISLYAPLWPVTRDQMAVFIARAFGLST